MTETAAGLMNSTKHSEVRRAARRASYDLNNVLELVNDLKLGHLGFISDGRPVIIPITLWVADQTMYFHVPNKSRLQKFLEAGGEFCVSVAECSEWVMAKSAYDHSANYRSDVLFCTGERVHEEVEFDHAFRSIINDLESGRWENVRPPSKQERKGTALMRLVINEGAFKSRTGGPSAAPEDADWTVWEGLLPACPFGAGR